MNDSYAREQLCIDCVRDFLSTPNADAYEDRKQLIKDMNARFNVQKVVEAMPIAGAADHYFHAIEKYWEANSAAYYIAHIATYGRTEMEPETVKEEPVNYQVQGVSKELLAHYHEQAEKTGIPLLENGLPSRLCIEPNHPDYNDCWNRVGVKFDGRERKSDVYAYDVAEGFIRVHLRDNKGRFKKERGRFVTTRLNGVVEPYWR